MLADMVARDGGGNGAEGALDVAACSRLQIEGVDVAESPPGENYDTAAGLAETLCFWCHTGVGSLG